MLAFSPDTLSHGSNIAVDKGSGGHHGEHLTPAISRASIIFMQGKFRNYFVHTYINDYSYKAKVEVGTPHYILKLFFS